MKEAVEQERGRSQQVALVLRRHQNPKTSELRKAERWALEHLRVSYAVHGFDLASIAFSPWLYGVCSPCKHFVAMTT